MQQVRTWRWLQYIGLIGSLWLCAGTSWVYAKAPKKQETDSSTHTIGDISFRFDVGPELFRLSMASGEPIEEAIAQRSVRLNFNLEYGYFLSDNTVIFVTLPFAFDIDLIVGTAFFLDLGAGFRRFFGRFVYIDARVLVTFVTRNRFVFNFGGIDLGVGAAIPMGQQLRLLVLARIPFNFIGGFRFRVQGGLGVEVLF